MEKGYTHIYTGNGKGKTTAAIGLAVRSLCIGKKVYIGQFIKDMAYNETKLVNKFDNLTIEQLGCGCFIDRDPTKEDEILASNGLKHCAKILKSGKYDLVILDEITIAVYFKLIKSSDIILALKQKYPSTEVILTGRYASKDLIVYADLVTEMKEIKHYYTTQGVLSRDGIDK